MGESEQERLEREFREAHAAWVAAWGKAIVAEHEFERTHEAKRVAWEARARARETLLRRIAEGWPANIRVNLNLDHEDMPANGDENGAQEERP